MVDRKLEPVIKRKMMEYLGELEDDDLVMFIVEHLKDKKGPQKLVEGLEPVRFLLFLLNLWAYMSRFPLTFCCYKVLVEEAEEFVIALWRQVTFESMAYGEGLDSGRMIVEG